MNARPLAWAVVSTASLGLLAFTARGAATSRSVGTYYGTQDGSVVPVPESYRAAARRRRDERDSPRALLLHPGGLASRAWDRAARLDDGAVLVEFLPLDDARVALARARGLKLKPIDGLSHPAFAEATDGRVRVHIITPKRVVRMSAARWHTAFDEVLRGYRDEA